MILNRQTGGQSGSKILRGFWFITGALALLAGAIGIFLPVIPTTPFVILAAFAFGKSAPKLQAKLEANKTFGPIIAQWKQSGAIAPRYKIMALAMMAAAFGLSLYAGLAAYILIIQAVCLSCAALFILTRPNGTAVLPGDRAAESTGK
ncbi:MAG: YbaN family protein [Rhodobacteraceae bacterium]|nr:YbaN family protein [Paracoccaceae bacterium]